MKTWLIGQDNNLDNNSLNNLLENKIGSIICKEFASLDECMALANAISIIGFDNYIGVEPKIGRIGITQFEAKQYGMDWYFDNADKANKIHKKIFSLSFDPLLRLIRLLQKNSFKVSIAHEVKNNRKYFCGLVRQINNSALLHADYAPYDAPGWVIGEIKAQLAWNLCIEEPFSDGDCVVYNKHWCLEDEKYKMENSYGYSRAIIRDVEHQAIKIKTGDCYFFNCRNYHEVTKCNGNRLTISCFMGLLSEDEILIWS